MGSTTYQRGRSAGSSGMVTIKKECVYRHRFKSRDEARIAIFDHIEGYCNPHRRHSSLGNLSPLERRHCSRAL